MVGVYGRVSIDEIWISSGFLLAFSCCGALLSTDTLGIRRFESLAQAIGIDLMGDSMIWTRQSNVAQIAVIHESMNMCFSLRRPSLSYMALKCDMIYGIYMGSCSRNCATDDAKQMEQLGSSISFHVGIFGAAAELSMNCDTAPLLETGESSGDPRTRTLLETGGSSGDPRTRKPWNGNDLREFVWNSKPCCGTLEQMDQGSKSLAPSPQWFTQWNSPQIVEGSLEVKLPTIWTDEKQRWKESEKRREEERR